MKSLYKQIGDYFGTHSAAKIVLYIVALLLPVGYFVSDILADMLPYFWISFYSCIFLFIALPHSSAPEQIFSIILIILNAIPIGILFFGSLMMFPVGPLIVFVYLWIPQIPFVNPKISLGLGIVIVILLIAFISRKRAAHQTNDDTQKE